MQTCAGAMVIVQASPLDLPGFSLTNPRRNGTLRRRTDNAVGTSFGTTAAACTQQSAASHPSSRSACRQKNLQNSLDRTASLCTPEALAPAGCTPTGDGSHDLKSKFPLDALGASSPQG